MRNWRSASSAVPSARAGVAQSKAAISKRMRQWSATSAAESKYHRTMRATSTALAAAVALGAALLVAPWAGHLDDTDAHLYTVVARKLAESRAWLDPAYLDHLYPHFREHL